MRKPGLNAAGRIGLQRLIKQGFRRLPRLAGRIGSVAHDRGNDGALLQEKDLRGEPVGIGSARTTRKICCPVLQ